MDSLTADPSKVRKRILQTRLLMVALLMSQLEEDAELEPNTDANNMPPTNYEQLKSNESHLKSAAAPSEDQNSTRKPMRVNDEESVVWKLQDGSATSLASSDQDSGLLTGSEPSADYNPCTKERSGGSGPLKITTV